MDSTTVEQILQTEIEESNKWLDTEHDESTYKQDLEKRNQTHSILEADKLHNESRILDWILYQVCSDENKYAEQTYHDV